MNLLSFPRLPALSTAPRKLIAMLRRAGEFAQRHQRWLAIAGLLLAQVLVALLYQVVSGNVERNQRAREHAVQFARDQQRCRLESEPLARERCGLSVQLREPMVVLVSRRGTQW